MPTPGFPLLRTLCINADKAFVTIEVTALTIVLVIYYCVEGVTPPFAITVAAKLATFSTIRTLFGPWNIKLNSL
jgi:hypothetical protein